MPRAYVPAMGFLDPLHEDLFTQIEEARQTAGRGGKKLTKDAMARKAKLTPKGMDKWRNGGSVQLDTLELVAASVKRRLIVRLAPMSDPNASVTSSTYGVGEEDTVTDGALGLARLLDQHFPEGSPGRTEALATARGVILGMASSSPHAPDAEEVGHRAR